MHPTPHGAPRRARRPAPPAGLRRILVPALLAALLVAPGVAPSVASPALPRAPESGPAATAPLVETQFARRLSGEVYGFLPYWEIDAGTDAYLRYDLLTDIALFSVGFTASGAVSTSATGYATVTGATAATIAAHAHAAGVRVDLTVTSFGFDKNAAFFTNPTAMATAAAAISNLVQAEGLDGVNLDVEELYNENFAAYGTFVGQIRAALRAWNPAARVSVATNASISGAGMALQALANGADRVFIMGYNYRSSGSSPAGSISPITRSDGDKSLTWTLDLYAQKGVPADRIILGLPYYGRSWNTTSGALNAPTTSSVGVFIPSDDVAAIPAGTVIQHDPVEGTKWFAVPNPSTGAWTQTYFDDGTTLRAKYGLATSRGLVGVGIWALGYDRGVVGYWDAIVGSFGTVRKAGADRYTTAAAISADTFGPGVATAYIATGAAFPDALAAAAVAGGSGSPVLLVTATTIPTATALELARLTPGRIVVVGGPSVVSDAVVAALSTYSPWVYRFAGADRYETAAALSAGTFAPGVPVAYLTVGSGFADAVSAAPVAARDHGPVLLTQTDTIPPATAAELARLRPGRVVIVGGPSVVSDAVVWALDFVVHGTPVFRLSGADRYGTSAAVAATFAPNVPAVYVATGLDFPDALAAAAAAGAQGSPMVLTAPTALPDVVRAEIVRLNPARAIIAGGPAAVSDAVLVAIQGAVAS